MLDSPWGCHQQHPQGAAAKLRTMREAVQVHFILPHTAALCAIMSAQEAVLTEYAGDKAPKAMQYPR